MKPEAGDPILPPRWEPADASAVQAVSRGDASPDQQIRALRWIVESAGMAYDMEFRHDDRKSCFASGRRFVALQIIKLLKINPTAFVKES